MPSAAGEKSASEHNFFKDKLVENQAETGSPSQEGQEEQWALIAKNVSKSAAASEDIEDWAIVVDDSPTSIKVLATTLKSLNLGVHAFRDAPSALTFLKDASEKVIGKVLIVFSDLEMPGMDGVEFLCQLRNSARTEKVPFVLVSGAIERKALSRMTAFRPDGIVVKPFDGKLIVDHVMKALIARQKKTTEKSP